MEKISKYWKKRAECYNKRSDEGAKIDSQDEYDHGVWPMDPNVMVYKNYSWCYCLIRGIRHAEA